MSFHLAVLYENAGKVTQAIEQLELLTRSPLQLGLAKIHLDLGRLYFKQKDFKKARLNLEKTLEEKQENFTSVAHYLLEQMP